MDLPGRIRSFLLACAAATVLLLLVLIAKARLHPALALVVSALTLGVASGMPLNRMRPGKSILSL